MKNKTYLRALIFALFFSILCSPALASESDAGRSFLDICESGTAQEIELALRDGASVFDRDEENFTPLMAAAIGNSTGALSVLLKAGAAVNTSDLMGLTPLMYAAGNNRDANVCQALIEAGAAVNESDDEGFTPLMYAAINNDPAVIEALIKAGSRLSLRNNNGKTALDLALMNGNFEGVSVLRKYMKSKPPAGSVSTER